MTFIKQITPESAIMAMQNCDCDDIEEESCEIANSGTQVTGTVDVKNTVSAK